MEDCDSANMHTRHMVPMKRRKYKNRCLLLGCFLTVTNFIFFDFLGIYYIFMFDIEEVKQDFQCKKCSLTESSVIISPEICRTSTEIEILFLVTSRPGQTQYRDMIRKTWGSLSEQRKYNVRLVFLLGKSDNATMIMEESNRYHDILQINFIEMYGKLTIKTIEGFRWVVYNCPNVKYVMKTDDDVFIHIDNLMTSLQLYNLNNSIGGKLLSRAKPFRIEYFKFYISNEKYPYQYFPPYCAGQGYIMTYNTAKLLYSYMINTKYIAWEDVFVGIASSRAGVNFTHLPGFHDVRYSFRHRCTALDHKVIVEQVHRFWKTRGEELEKCNSWIPNWNPDTYVFILSMYFFISAFLASI